MKLGSACSGVGCIDLGLERAGFEPAWQIEIDSTCRAVLERHWPDTERLEDLTDAAQPNHARVDLIAGGTPCQDLSVAGKGAGLDGERSSLFYDFIRLADSQPWAFVLWENVPGALSSNEGRDFAVCMEGFTGARFEVPPDGWRNSGVATGSYRWAVWRVLDAQAFGVPQRRRRIFVVAGPRGRCGPEILLEPESVPGHPAPCGSEGQTASGILAGGPGGRGWRLGADEAAGGQIVAGLTSQGVGSSGPDDNQAQQIAYQCHGSNVGGMGTLRTGHNEGGGVPFVASPLTASSNKTTDTAGSGGSGPKNLVFQERGRPGGRSLEWDKSGVSYALTSPNNGSRSQEKNLLDNSLSPRRLTPTECERLQGLPDDWTKYRADGSEIADGPRYRMIGNGAAVPVPEWIGKRIPRTR